MNANVNWPELEKLNNDYSQITGQRFSYFFCPILFRDEDVHICKAHIVNQALPDAPLDWTVQRKDADNFYGSTFEAEFIAIQYIDQTHADVFTDKKLSKLFKPQILVENKPVDFFLAGHEVPKDFIKLEFNNDGQIIKLGIKMSPEDFSAAKDKNWEMAISKDVRISALVSLIKAAHLTMFKMLGYRYALSAGSYFVGRHILGEFFMQNYGKPKPDILESARPFFRKFGHMVRPIHSSQMNFQGTITDNQLLLCQESGDIAWAVIVFVKTSRFLHAVLLPFFDQPDSVARFFRFLEDKNNTIAVALMEFTEGHFNLKSTTTIIWPKDGTLYPE